MKHLKTFESHIHSLSFDVNDKSKIIWKDDYERALEIKKEIKSVKRELDLIQGVGYNKERSSRLSKAIDKSRKLKEELNKIISRNPGIEKEISE